MCLIVILIKRQKIESKSQNFLNQNKNTKFFPDLLTCIKVCPTHLCRPIDYICLVIFEYMIKTDDLEVGASSCRILDSCLK